MSKLLIDDKPVMVLPKLAEAIGLNEAIVLQQIHYWLKTYQEANKKDHYRDGEWWVYNTKAEWKENFPWWSESTVWRALTSLRDMNLVITSNKYNKKGYDRTLWYRINREKLEELERDILSDQEKPFCQNDKMDNANMTTPIPETNTENTHINDNGTKPVKQELPGMPEKPSRDTYKDLRQFFVAKAQDCEHTIDPPTWDDDSRDEMVDWNAQLKRLKALVNDDEQATKALIAVAIEKQSENPRYQIRRPLSIYKFAEGHVNDIKRGAIDPPRNDASDKERLRYQMIADALEPAKVTA